MKNNPDESVVSEVANADADLTADASKTNEKYDDMKVLEKEEQKTVGYQETLKMDVKNIEKTPRQHVDQYMRLSMLNF